MTARPLPVPTTAADVSLLLHEAVVVGRYGDALVVQRRRPFIPCGLDGVQHAAFPDPQ
jgi:hypothetical protein